VSQREALFDSKLKWIQKSTEFLELPGASEKGTGFPFPYLEYGSHPLGNEPCRRMEIIPQHLWQEHLTLRLT
jgi:hypothetical protein